MGQKPSTEETIIEMRLKSKELMRMSNRAVREEKSEKLKVKEAIRKGNRDGARIFAQNAIRKNHESLSYLQLSSKLDAVASRLDAAYRSQQMTKEIHKAVPGLASVMNSLDIPTLASGMDRFERLFEDLDVRAEYVANAIESTTASATPIDQVDQLIAQVAEEHALDVADLLSDAPAVSGAIVRGDHEVANRNLLQKGAPKEKLAVADPLEDRLKNL